MTVMELMNHLSTHGMDEEATVWFREEENLTVVEVNTPGHHGAGCIIWVADKEEEKQPTFLGRVGGLPENWNPGK